MTTERIRWARRIYHLSGIPISLIYWFGFGEEKHWIAVLICLGLTALFFGFDVAKWRSQWVRDFLLNQLRSIATPRDLKPLNSSTMYLLGCTVTLALFSAPAAVTGILILALSDNAASIIGRLWGRHRIGNKSIEGAGVFLIVAWLIGLPFGGPIPALGAALFSALAELLIQRIDDNLTVPFTAALGFKLFSYL